MGSYRLTPAAKADILEIGRYTQKKWGREQRSHYLTALDNRFQWLADQPQLGKSRDDIKPGIVSYPQGEHIIFYRCQSDSIEILRILHQRSDSEQHL